MNSIKDFTDKFRKAQKGQPHHGENVELFRRFKKLTQKDLAEFLKVSQQTISDYENSEILPEEVISKIASILEISPYYLRDCTPEDLYSMFVKIETGANNSNVVGVVGNEVVNLNTSSTDLINELLSNYREVIETLKADKAELRAEIAEYKKEIKELRK